MQGVSPRPRIKRHGGERTWDRSQSTLPDAFIWAKGRIHWRGCQTRQGPGFLVAPPSKPVVVNQILLHEQIARLASADLNECMEWLDTTAGWGGTGDVNMDGGGNKRIRVSGDQGLDDAVTHEHNLYNATGSIEAQARIDSYIIPCMVCRVFGEPFKGNAMRNRIPGYMWREMTKRTDPMDVLQYHTLPDLGIYIRERMKSHSTWIPTHQSSQQHVNGGGSGSRSSRTTLIGGTAKPFTTICVNAFSHSCCSVTAPQARNDASMDRSRMPLSPCPIRAPRLGACMGH